MANVLVSEDSLQDMGNAIREKLNTDTTYLPSEMAAAVLSISGGGGEVSPKQPGQHTVNFFDFDGTLLKTFYVDSGGSVAPPLPPDRSSDELIFDMWNHSSATLSNVTRDMDVGAVYKTADGKTHIHVIVDPNYPYGLRTGLCFSHPAGTEMSVDWGDGTSNIYTDATKLDGGQDVWHTYAAAGYYVIKLWMSSGTGTYTLSHESWWLPLVNMSYAQTLLKLFVGDNVPVLRYNTIGEVSYGYTPYSLSEIMLPASVTSIDASAFPNPVFLKFLVYPPSAIQGHGITGNMPSLRGVSLSDQTQELPTFYNYEERYHVAIPRLSIPASVNTPTLRSGCFRGCGILGSFESPVSVNTIQDQAFKGCYSVQEYMFSQTVPPTLTNTDAFYGMHPSCKIYVPDESVNAYKTATNWAVYARQIYPVSERVTP